MRRICENFLQKPIQRKSCQQNSESVTFIAYKNGTPLGYLKLNVGNAQTEKCLDNALEIQRIYILKSAKGQGIGSAFMQIAENFASEKKLSTIWLGVWEHNEPAKKFYKSKGYEKERIYKARDAGGKYHFLHPPRSIYYGARKC